MNKLAKKISDVKMARVDRKFVLNGRTWHNIKRKAFNKASRAAAKLELKQRVA